MQENKLLRLNKFISNSGLCTRREADVYIKNHCITVNNQVVSTLGQKVKWKDLVKFKGKRIFPYPFRFILLNKPKKFECDKSNPKNIFSLISKSNVQGSLTCICPLKNQYSGLVLITNKILNGIQKKSYLQIFHIKLDNDISKKDLNEIKSKSINPHFYIKSIHHIKNDKLNEIGLEIFFDNNFKKLERLFKNTGCNITFLDRVCFSNFNKKDLSRGKWREIDKKEIKF